MIYIFLFLLGSCFASFLMVFTFRIEKGESLKETLLSRSRCDNCRKKLSWYELIPIFSYIIQKGKCWKCKKKLSILYPILEILLGISFMFVYESYGINIWYFILILFLFSLSYWDLLSKYVPQILVHLFLIFALTFAIFHFSIGNIYSLSISILIGLVVIIVNRFKEVMGLGDILVIIGISAILPIVSFSLFLILSLLLAGIFSIIFVLIDRKNRKKYIPLLPFMYISFLLTPLLYPYFIEYIHFLW